MNVDQREDVRINVANFLQEIFAAIHPPDPILTTDRTSVDRPTVSSAIDDLDLGQDNAENVWRVLSHGHGFSASRQQAGRDCRSEIEVVPLAVNLWNTATGRAIRSIIRFELRPSNCARVIRASRLLLPFRYIGPQTPVDCSPFMITAGWHPVVTIRSHQLYPAK